MRCCRSRKHWIEHPLDALVTWGVNGSPSPIVLTWCYIRLYPVSLLFLLYSGFLPPPFDESSSSLCALLILTEFCFFLIVSFVWFKFPSSCFYFARVVSCTVGGTPWTWKSLQPPFSSASFSLELFIRLEQHKRFFKSFFVIKLLKYNIIKNENLYLNE